MATIEQDGVVKIIKRGPKPKYGDEKMLKSTFRLPKQYSDLLKKLSKRLKKSQDELIREAIEELLCRARLL